MKTILLSQINPQNQILFEQKIFCEAKASGEIILLLYSWKPKVISVGKLQKNLKINYGKCERDGVKIVERITGGRAVLHSNDICYSVSIPKKFVKKTGGNLKEAIISISQPIIKTLADFGIVTENKTYKLFDSLRSDFCAQTHSYGEISIGDKKLCASSQIYTENGILQQGTIPVTSDYLKICDYFEGEVESAKKILRKNSTYLRELCPNLKIDEFLERLAENFMMWGEKIANC